ncbi:hypothetical protein LMOSLCC5850_0666 [Listeria monocytogenes SLCC5850]|nr:hypothetical protein LMOSLCC5850_0666 [Listeria monocytogenes SLCC5850]
MIPLFYHLFANKKKQSSFHLNEREKTIILI